MNASDLQDLIVKKVRACRHVEYKGISIGESLQVAFFSYVLAYPSRDASTDVIFIRHCRLLASILKRIIVATFSRKPTQQQRHALPTGHGKRIVVVCDHHGHVERMTLSLLDRFAEDEILLLTSRPQIFRRLKDKFPTCLSVCRPIHALHIKDVSKCYSYYKKVSDRLDSKGSLFKLFLFSTISSVVPAIDYYEAFFDTVEAKAVMTMSDRHWYEYVVTKCAQKRAIPTYTNQHGWFGVPCNYVPVASDRIFVWGEKSREYLIGNGVASEKVVISGNPHFDRVHAEYLPRRAARRAEFCDRHGLDPEKLLVTYLSSSAVDHICPIASIREFFECFSWTATLPVNIVVKLRKQEKSGYRELYRTWMRELDLTERILILDDVDLFECLAATDIAVTTLSSVGLEAMGFGIPTIALNVIDGLDVTEYAAFAADAIECTSSDLFRRVINQLVTEPRYYQAELGKAAAVQKAYFHNSDENNCSRIVHDYITAETSR